MQMLNKWLLVLLLTVSSSVFAADLKTAKAQGWIGEQQDGYLGLVKGDAPADVKALVAEVNGQRKAHFAQIAAKTNATPAHAAQVFAKEAAERTEPGNYVQDAGGNWVRK